MGATCARRASRIAHNALSAISAASRTRPPPDAAASPAAGAAALRKAHTCCCGPARKPDCPQCVIRDICRFKEKTAA
ncbi:hypothetical protein [Pseudoxanthomonas mexicana]